MCQGIIISLVKFNKKTIVLKGIGSHSQMFLKNKKFLIQNGCNETVKSEIISIESDFSDKKLNKFTIEGSTPTKKDKKLLKEEYYKIAGTPENLFNFVKNQNNFELSLFSLIKKNISKQKTLIYEDYWEKRKPIEDECDEKLKSIYVEFEKKRKSIYDEYIKNENSIYKEYCKKRVTIDEEYNEKRNLIYEKYNEKRNLIYEEFEKKRKLIYDECTENANSIRDKYNEKRKPIHDEFETKLKKLWLLEYSEQENLTLKFKIKSNI